MEERKSLFDKEIEQLKTISNNKVNLIKKRLKNN